MFYLINQLQMYCETSSLENSLLLLREESLLQSVPVPVCKGSGKLQHRLGGWVAVKRQKWIVSQCWRPEVHTKASAGWVLSKGSEGKLCSRLFSLTCRYVAFSVCESVSQLPLFFFYKYFGHIGFRSTTMTSF